MTKNKYEVSFTLSKKDYERLERTQKRLEKVFEEKVSYLDTLDAIAKAIILDYLDDVDDHQKEFVDRMLKIKAGK